MRELPTTDALVVLGGDGTFLRAARAVAEVDVPLLGINLGKVGFLSKAEAGDLETVLERIVAGEYTIDERMVIEGRILRGGGASGEARAAHRAQRHRRRPRRRWPGCAGSTSRIDDTHLATFIADGLVVASPTGSHRLLVLRRRPDPRPGQPEPRRHADRRLPVGASARSSSAPSRSSAAASSTRTRRSSRSTAARTCRSPSATSSRSAPSTGRSASSNRSGAQPFWDLLRHKVELLPS